MQTITVWLLMSLGSSYSAGSPHMVVERFATKEECVRVSEILRGESRSMRNPVQCIQATILVRS